MMLIGNIATQKQLNRHKIMLCNLKKRQRRLIQAKQILLVHWSSFARCYCQVLEKPLVTAYVFILRCVT